MIDELDLTEGHAEAVIQKAIEFEVYSDDMPTTKKDKMEDAHEIVAFAIDSWVNDGMRPDSDDEGEATAGKMIEQIFEIAGVEVDDDDDVTYNEPPELDGDDGDDDDESAVDIDDIIEGYEELTAATRLKKIKALDLDPDDDDDYNTLVSIAEWEEAQDKPASRVLDYLNDVLPEEVDGEAADDEDDETADDAGDDGDEGEDEPWDEESLLELDKEELAEVAGEFDVEMPKRMTATGKKKVVDAILEAQDAGEEGDDDNDGDDDEDSEEPWEGYDETSIKDIKEALEEAKEDEDEPLSDEQVEMVLEYEKANENRKSLVKWLTELHEELSGSDDDNDDDDEPEPEEKPARKGRGRAKTKTADPDDSDDADEAKAKDDRKDAKAGKGGTLIITRAQILEALESGEVEIKLG